MENARARPARAPRAGADAGPPPRDASGRTPGPGFEPIPAAELLADEQKIRRSLRYLHLNPCRDGLADDPLAWAFSTHRDACGLMVQPVVPPRRDPAGFHAYVSADPHVSITGTPLPGGQLARMPVLDVLAAVSAVTRTTLSGMKQRGPARTWPRRCWPRASAAKRPRWWGCTRRR